MYDHDEMHGSGARPKQPTTSVDWALGRNTSPVFFTLRKCFTLQPQYAATQLTLSTNAQVCLAEPPLEPVARTPPRRHDPYLVLLCR